MKILILSLFLLLGVQTTFSRTDDADAVEQMLDRVGGNGTGKRFVLKIDRRLQKDDAEMFTISARHGKPCITGSNVSALCVGVNWYLNHYAHVNISWNQLTAEMRDVDLPLPKHAETHRCDTPMRYYLNYCTFGYSMTTWTWERWQKEIDWMALHGINMPLQLIGLETVWRNLLMLDYGYAEDDAEEFVPGPAFTAWWGMNNLEGWGGDGDDASRGVHDDAWYERQTRLARLICERERELGMQPVLPGFSGMVPSNFEQKTGLSTEKANLWCQFQRPAILDPTSTEFASVARNYYKRLEEVMGTSLFYSMDPFHEGGTISSGRYAEGYEAVFRAMNENCGERSQWVIQQWQWAPYQATSLTSVPSGRLVVLDLFSDGRPQFDHYNGYAPQQAVYCTIPNFGGRTGFMGRLPKMASNFFEYKRKYSSIRGIGAAPEAIESVPVVYDLLFELPWLDSAPDVGKWIEQYALCRYGKYNEAARNAWRTILNTAMNETTSLQGPHEAVMCGRPSLNVEKVSSWGGSHIFYDKELFRSAAYQLLSAAREIGTQGSIGAKNMSYDLTDIVRQVLSDHSKTLLAEIKDAYNSGQTELFNQKADRFLELILDTDRLLGTNQMFRLGNWTETARKAAEEIEGATTATADWLELANARTLITTWGDEKQSEKGGLRDYSYRQWQGLLRDFYYPRWYYYFKGRQGMLSEPAKGWFYSEWNWSHEMQGEWADTQRSTKKKTVRTYYSATPEGDTEAIARELLSKYF